VIRTPTLTGTLLLGLASTLAAQAPHRLSGPESAIYNLVGTITVRGGTGGDVTVEVATEGADASRLRVETDPINGIPTLRVVYPEDEIVWRGLGRGSKTNFSIREDGTWGGRGRAGRRSRQITVRGDGSGLEAAANLTVTVPRGKTVAVYLGVGKIEASNVDGTLRLDGASADIRATDTKGRLNIDTGSGDVVVSGAEGDLEIDTGSGDVRVDRARGAELEIDTGSGDVIGGSLTFDRGDISTGSGGIRMESFTGPALELETGSGDVNVLLTGSPNRLDVETGSGDVTIRVAADVDASIELSTGSGDFEVDFPLTLTRRSDNSLSGRMGNGKGRITIETGSGDIAIKK
jgi:lia operon protein LiaG